MEQGYELRLIDIKRAALEQSQRAELYIPLHGKHTTNPEEEPFDLAEKIQSFFVFDDASQHDPKVMLLMGDTGSGKSVFSQQLHQQLWRAYKSGDPIPLWIPLPELQNPFEGAVEEVMRKYGFYDEQIAHIKAKERFVFVVDGYEELHQFQNCYVTNKWEKWNAKVLITCRSQALYYQKDPDKYFMPFNGEKRLPVLLRKLYLAAFSKEQIRSYVRQYQQLNAGHTISEEDFAKIPGLTELINTPFLLHLAVEALPDILAAQVNDEKMTQAKLYDVFIERWFIRQVKKLSAAGLLKDTEQNTKKQFWDYCKKLAQQMHAKEVSVIPYQGQKVGGRLFGKQEQANSWEPFFNEETEVLRSACPLRRYGKHYYGFIHASMVEYFATRSMYEDIQWNEPTKIQDEIEDKQYVHNKSEFSREANQPKGGIHHRVFAQEKNVIQFLADRIVMSEAFKLKMLTILELSKESKRYANGAANAITALVIAGVTFNGANLSGIDISGADISGGYFDRADISKSNLTDVYMFHSWLREASLEGSQLVGVNFGEYPWFKQTDMVLGFDYREDLNLLVTTCGKKLVLWDTETGDPLNRLKGHTHRTRCVKFSPDAKLLVSGSNDKTVRVWNVKSGYSINELRGHEDGVYSISFHPNGKWVVSGSDDNTIRIWEVVSGVEIAILRGHSGPVNSVNFSPDGLYVVSGSQDKTVRIWNIMGSSESTQLHGHKFAVRSVEFSPNGQYVISGSEDRSMRIWEVSSGEVIVIRDDMYQKVSAAFSRDMNWIVCGNMEHSVQVWDRSSRKEVATLLGHTGCIRCVVFSVDGKRVLSGSDDTTVRMWDVASGRFNAQNCGHEQRVKNVRFNSNGKKIISASDSYSEAYKIWDVESGKEITAIENQYLSLSSGKKIISASDFSREAYKILDVESGEEITAIENQYLSLSSGKKIISASDFSSEAYKIWGVESGKEITAIENQYLSLSSLSYTAGKYVVSKNRYLSTICKKSTGEVIYRLSEYMPYLTTISKSSGEVFHRLAELPEYMPERITFSSNMDYVAVYNSESKTLNIIEVDSGMLKVEFTGQDEILCVSFSSDGNRIVTGNNKGTISIWELDRRRKIKKLHGHKNAVTCIAFSPTGERVVSGGPGDNLVQVWWVESGQKIELSGHTSYIVDVVFTPDGKSVLSVSDDRALRVWDLASEKCISVLKFHVEISDFSYHPTGFLVVGLKDGSIYCWQNVGAQNYRCQLCFSTYTHSRELNTEGLRILNVIGLSDQNRRMLEQRGAIVLSKAESKALTSRAKTKWGTAKRTGSPVHHNNNNETKSDNTEDEEKARSCVIA